MTIDAGSTRVDSAEMTKPKTGILHVSNSKTQEWCVLSDGGERFIFNASMCQSTDGDNGEAVFQSLRKGDKISFVRGEGVEYDVAKNVALISHTEATAALVPATGVSVAGVLDLEAKESPEAMGPQMNGTVTWLNPDGFSRIKGSDGKEYLFHHATCKGKFDTFFALKTATKVVFNKLQGNGIVLVATNVAIDTSEE